MNQDFFFPYQKLWLADKSKIKIAEKSRRVGWTFVQAFEDVLDCVEKTVPKVWFSSVNELAGKEYIDYCKSWAISMNIACEDLGEKVIDEKDGVKALTVKFENGTFIYALTSNPAGFRGKQGKIILDEFAHHKDQNELWRAAQPCLLWGFPMRIISTHNGKSGRYYKMIEDTKAQKNDFSLHTVTLADAVEDGLADKITGRKLSKDEKSSWIESVRKECGDEGSWQQEYCCVPLDESSAFLSYELIESCKSDCLQDLSKTKDDLYLGRDMARKGDFTIIHVLERLGDVLYLRYKKEDKNRAFSDQEEDLFKLLKLPKMRRGCLDSTGMGMQPAEAAQKEFGEHKVEAVSFTQAVKEELAFGLLRKFQDKTIRIPDCKLLTEDLHSVKRMVTKAGNVRFDAERSETDGHGDRFWALALAVHAAAQQTSGPIEIMTGKSFKAAKMLKNYFSRL